MIPVTILSGQAGSGKDTIAGMLAEIVGARAIAQADPMKELVRSLIGFTTEQLWGPSHRRMEATPVVDLRRRFAGVAGRWLESIGLAKDPSAYDRLHDWARGLERAGSVTARHALQTLGTEWGRAQSPSLWVDLALVRARRLLADGAPLVLITDGRFRNEVLAVRAAGGGAVRIRCPGAGLSGASAQHASEAEQAQIPDSWFDVVLLNDKSRGLDALRESVQALAGYLLPEPRHF